MPSHAPENDYADADALTEVERDEVKDRASPRAIVVHEVIREEGEIELRRSAPALAWAGLAAGLSMGFSMVGVGLIQAMLPEASWAPLLGSLGYSLGFLIVILGRQQLFTENTLTAVLPLLYRRDATTFGRMLRLWSIVLAANIAGTLLFAFAVAHGAIFKPEVRHEFLTLGLHQYEDPFWSTLLQGVFAGWLIALIAWLVPAAGSAKLLIIVILTYFVSLAGLPHIIAGSSEAAFAAIEGAAGWGEYLGRFIVPTLIGNTVGGVSLVALLNHAQVAPELQRSR